MMRWEAVLPLFAELCLELLSWPFSETFVLDSSINLALLLGRAPVPGAGKFRLHPHPGPNPAWPSSAKLVT